MSVLIKNTSDNGNAKIIINDSHHAGLLASLMFDTFAEAISVNIIDDEAHFNSVDKAGHPQVSSVKLAEHPLLRQELL